MMKFVYWLLVVAIASTMIAGPGYTEEAQPDAVVSTEARLQAVVEKLTYDKELIRDLQFESSESTNQILQTYAQKGGIEIILLVPHPSSRLSETPKVLGNYRNAAFRDELLRDTAFKKFFGEQRGDVGQRTRGFLHFGEQRCPCILSVVQDFGSPLGVLFLAHGCNMREFDSRGFKLDLGEGAQSKGASSTIQSKDSQKGSRWSMGNPFSKSTLTLDVDLVPQLISEVHRLLRMLSLPKASVEQSSGKVVVKFSKILSSKELKAASNTLERAILLKPVLDSPKFTLSISEERVGFSKKGLSSSTKVVSKSNLQLDAAKGNAGFYQYKAPWLNGTFCAYEVESHADVSLSSLISEADNRSKGAVTESGLRQMLVYEIVASPSDWQGLADQMKILSQNKVIFVFYEKPWELGGKTAGVTKNKTQECESAIVQKANDEFFRFVLFPELSRGLKSFLFSKRFLF